MGAAEIAATVFGKSGRHSSAKLSFNGGFIIVSDYVRMEVTLVGASWDVVAGDQTGVDFIPMKRSSK